MVDGSCVGSTIEVVGALNFYNSVGSPEHCLPLEHMMMYLCRHASSGITESIRYAVSCVCTTFTAERRWCAGPKVCSISVSAHKIRTHRLLLLR